MKNCLITGVTGNLGEAVARHFLDSGFRVWGVARKGTPTPFDNSPHYTTLVADLADDAQVRNIVKDIVANGNTIDMLAATAGGFASGNLAKTDSQALQSQIQLNFITAYTITQAVFLQMQQQGAGRIFLTAARNGIQMRDTKGAVAYGLSKSLIFRLAELLNAEAKSADIVTSVIVPSTIDTPENRAAMPDADFSTWVQPTMIAETIAYYASENARHLREPVIKVYNKA
jgi:NAD(P)-dependent dehydrogenase (short-subunit alcohol dehydrogenase family)